MAGILVIIDGMTEGGLEGLDAPTPMGRARMDTLAAFARQGGWGFLETCPPGLAPGSLNCIGTLLGLAPEALPRGRAALEALAAGIPVGEEDLVLRCNFARVEDGVLLASGAGKAPASWPGLPEGMEYYPLEGYRALLVLRGQAAEAEALATWPPHQHQGEPAASLLPGGCALGERLAGLSRKSAGLFPGCQMLPWAPSVSRRLPGFADLHGCSGAAVSACPLVEGLARAMGMVLPARRVGSGDVDTDLAAKLAAALEAARRHPLVLVHLNGADEAAHRRDARQKTRFLARVEQEFLRPLAECFPGAILVTSDHGTSCRSGGHQRGAQPYFLRGKAPAPGQVLPGRAALELLKEASSWQRA